MRASSQSPTPMQQLQKNLEQAQHVARKPRVPKVADLMPGAIRIVPPKATQQTIDPVNYNSYRESPNRSQTKMHKSQTAHSKTIKLKVPQSKSSLERINVTSVKDQLDMKSTSNGSLFTSGRKPHHEHHATSGTFRVISNGRRYKLKKKLKQTLVETDSNQNSMLRKNFMTTGPADFESDSKSYATVPVKRAHGSQSYGSSERRQPVIPAPTTTTMPPLVHYNSKQPYEQQLVSQLLSAYSKQPCAKSRDKEAYHKTSFQRHNHNTSSRKVIQNHSSKRLPTSLIAKGGETIAAEEDYGDELSKSLLEPEVISLNIKGVKGISKPIPIKELGQTASASKPYKEQWKRVAIAENFMKKSETESVSLPGARSLLRGQSQSQNKHQQTLTSNHNFSDSPFSPTEGLSRVSVKTQAKTIQAPVERRKLRQPHIQLHNLKAAQPQNQQDSQTDRYTIADSASSLQIVPSRTMGQMSQQYQTLENKGRATDHKSLESLLHVTPKFVASTISQEKPRVEAVKNAATDKKSIYQLLQQNSQAFLRQEKEHIKDFRKAQSIQKKNIAMIIGSSLAPPIRSESKREFTQRTWSLNNRAPQILVHDTTHAPSSVQRQPMWQSSKKSLPHVGAATSTGTYAIMEEYGVSKTKGDRKMERSLQAKMSQKQLQRMMRMTNQTECAKELNHQKSLTQQRYTTVYPNFSRATFNLSSKQRTAAIVPDRSIIGSASIDEIDDGGSKANTTETLKLNLDEQEVSLTNTNRKNFFPSFDSRGNIGVIDDSNEFSKPFSRRKRSTIEKIVKTTTGQRIVSKRLGDNTSRDSRNNEGSSYHELPILSQTNNSRHIQGM